MKKYIFKFVSILSLISIVFMSLFPAGNIKDLFETKKAEAGAAFVFDGANFTIAFKDLVIYIGETLKKAAEAELKKQILDQLVNQIIQWIQGGGKPKFVTDFDGFLKEAGQNAVGQFAEALGLEFLCSPFNLQLKFALFPVAEFGGGSGRFSCTLDQIVGNIEDFQNDFRNGGWIAFDQSYEPQNNFYTLLIMANIEKNSRIAQATSKAVNEVNQASGYLSTEDCEEDPASNSPDQDGDGKKGDIPSRCTVTTPGRLAGDFVSKAIGSDIDFIINAEGIGKYVAAILDAAINSVIISGAKGLLGVTPKQTQNTRVDPCFGLTGKSLTACKDYQDSIRSQMGIQAGIFEEQISTQLDAREDAEDELDSIIVKLNNYEIDLNNIIGQFNPLSCPSKPASLSEINTELSYVIALKQEKLNENLENNLIITKFENAIIEMDNAVTAADQIGLSNAINGITANISNPKDGENFLNKQKADLETLEVRINDKLDRFNTLLTNCKAGL